MAKFIQKLKKGTDEFGKPIFREQEVDIGDPLINVENIASKGLLPADDEARKLGETEQFRQRFNIFSDEQREAFGIQEAPKPGQVRQPAIPGAPPQVSEPTVDPEITRLQSEVQQQEQELNNLKSKLTEFTISDKDLENEIAGIASFWDARISEMKEINRRRERSLFTSGVRLGSRFTGGVRAGTFGGIISLEETEGVERIGEIEGKKKQAIAAARTAAKNQNWKVFNVQLGLAEKANADKREELKKLVNAQAKQEEEFRKIKRQAQKESNVLDVFDFFKKQSPEETPTANDIFNVLNKDADGNLVDDPISFEDIDNILDNITEEKKRADSVRITAAANTGLNSLTGDEEKDAEIIKDLAKAEGISPNILLGKILELDQKKRADDRKQALAEKREARLTRSSERSKVDLFTLKDRQQRFPDLPLSLIGRPEINIQLELESSTPPIWFRELEQAKPGVVQTVTDEVLKESWETFRKEVLALSRQQSIKRKEEEGGELDDILPD